MKNKIFILVLFLIFGSFSFSQTNRGNINVHYGTVLIYKTYSIGYESFDFFTKSQKHHLSGLVRFGGWSASTSIKNSGLQTAFGISYLYGKGNHYFEHSSEMVFHFDKSLKDSGLNYIASLYRPFLGYRYQPLEKKFIFRIGVGWKEVFQMGFGYRF
jgi:hypothetical protein